MSRTACYNLSCLWEGMINTKLMGSNPIIKFKLNETNVQKKIGLGIKTKDLLFLFNYICCCGYYTLCRVDAKM